jgi:soluble lytic murein transglycosylase-like protein
VRRLLALILFASAAGAQQTPPPQSALDRAAAERNARHDKTRYDAFFKKYTKRYFGVGFDWQYFKAQGMAESELSATARSYVGARGIMQLMPSTFQEIQTKRPEFQSIDDPEWNIAAGIMHDRYLWKLWEPVGPDSDRTRFMFGSYNAGEGTIGRATAAAKAKQLDESRWPNIELVAPEVPRWRYRETLGYVKKIDQNFSALHAGDLRIGAPATAAQRAAAPAVPAKP